MADIEITVDGGTSKRLLTAGKYCDRDILVTATGGGGGEPDPPDDGKTRLYITIPPNATPDRPPTRNEVSLYIQQTVENGVTIDWGDGSEPETLPGNGDVNTTHTYSKAGDYIIILGPADECELGIGVNDTEYCIMGRAAPDNYVYCNMLKRAVLGSGGKTRITGYAFRNCYSLNSVIIPNDVIDIGKYAFFSCYSLSSVTIPDSVSYVRTYSFNSCYSLSSVTIPDNIIAIDSYSFGSCYGIKEYHILSTTPPNLYNRNAFSGIQADCIIYVPVGSLEAYQTATNWSTYADQMKEEGT